MRRQLVTVALAATLTVTIAFVVPLAILVRVLAIERAREDADRIVRTLIPVLVSADETAEALAVEQLQASTNAVVSVHLPDGQVLGGRSRTERWKRRVPAEQLNGRTPTGRASR